jgi:serine O-acetyltransferase
MVDDHIPLDDPAFAKALEAVLESYASHGGINHIEGDNLPSRERTVEVLLEIEEVLFPGYYDKERLSRLNVRYVIGDRLGRIYHGLVEEITKARSHRHRCAAGRAFDVHEDAEIRKSSRESAMAFIERIPEIRERLRRDAEAALAGDPAAESFVEVVMSYPSIRAIAAYRVAHILHQLDVPLIPRIMTEYQHSKTGIDIHPGAQISAGLFIDHGTGVVIGETTVIGKWVKIYQGVTLGALSVAKQEDGSWREGRRHPLIEDHVTLYAGATILGGDTVIGEGSIIGGNVWLTRTVAANTKVMINPPYLVFEDLTNGKKEKEPFPPSS